MVLVISEKQCSCLLTPTSNTQRKVLWREKHWVNPLGKQLPESVANTWLNVVMSAAKIVSLPRSFWWRRLADLCLDDIVYLMLQRRVVKWSLEVRRDLNVTFGRRELLDPKYDVATMSKNETWFLWNIFMTSLDAWSSS